MSLELTRRIYEVSSQGDFARDFALRDQIRRSAISVLSNIAEGFERDGDREFGQFLSVAKGSLGEVKAQLYVALRVGFVTQQQFDELYALATSIGRLIASLMRYLRQSEIKGLKLKKA